MSRIAYYFNDKVGTFYYGPYHPMKPFRIKITHEMLRAYGVLPKFNHILPEDHPEFVSKIDFTNFHSDEYISFLMNVNFENMNDMSEQLLYYSIGDDCPIFEGLGEFCKISGTGSLLGAHYINEGWSDVSINWSGGLHHAKRSEAVGFCYLNDCVLAILELLTKYQRVLYIDIDVHHGDGVEEAFLCTDRVMTCSFHKYGDYFPSSGSINDIGYGRGKYYAVNFPCYEGMDDISFEYIFKKTITNIMETFKPEAIVLQGGTDSLSGDRLGCFNLSIHGHSIGVKFVKTLGVPFMMLGGGGYTLRNVPRAWTYESALALGIELDNQMPQHEYLEYFYPEYKLQTQVSNMENANTPEYLNSILEQIESNLKNIHISNPDLNLNEGYVDPSPVKEYNPKDIEQEHLDEHPDEKYRENESVPLKNVNDI
ncbi:MAG: histone deacetylase [archaeon]|nr:histone deacetylase [archaeon]